MTSSSVPMPSARWASWPLPRTPAGLGGGYRKDGRLFTAIADGRQGIDLSVLSHLTRDRAPPPERRQVAALTDAYQQAGGEPTAGRRVRTNPGTGEYR